MRRASVLAIAALFAMTIPAIPAGAQLGAGTDPVGDQQGYFVADITDVVADYSDGVIFLGMILDRSHAPETDPNWVTNDTAATWRIAAPGLVEHEVVLYNDGDGLVAGLYSDLDDSLVCDAVAGYEDDTFFAAFDADCLGHPQWVMVAADFYYDTGDTVPSMDGHDETMFTGMLQETLTPDPGSGYWMVTKAGKVHAFGEARLCGDHPVADPATANVVDIEPYPFWVGEMNGYWTLDAAGNVEPHTCGLPSGAEDPFWVGDPAGRLPAGQSAVSLSATPSGNGYWVFTDKGEVFAYGDADFYGSLRGLTLNGPVLDSVVTPSGEGYWMVASDGGIFTFGDAKFFGSTGDRILNKPVVSMAPDPDGDGYWLVAADGGIFAFGAGFYGSAANLKLNKPISGMVTGTAGYLMVAEDGGIFSFGDVGFYGSLGNNPPPSPVSAVALVV